MIDGHTSNTKMIKDDYGVQNEVKTYTNIEENLSKNKYKRRYTPSKCKSFCKVMFSPYEVRESGAKAQDRGCSFMSELDKAFVESLSVIDGIDKKKQYTKKETKIDAVSCQTSLDSIQINNIVSEHSINTSEVFLQSAFCVFLPKNINKCIECHNNQFKKRVSNEDFANITCRFCAFRELRFTKTGNLSVSGYPTPSSDLIDMAIWLPDECYSLNISTVDIKMSLKIIKDVGSLFCQFYAIEKKALNLIKLYKRRNRRIAWKKTVNGVREMCDVCKTSLFNYHWFCGKCGFAVCIDCFAIDGTSETHNKKNEKNKWLNCSNKEEHQADKLLFAQIIAGNCLKKILYDMHMVCDAYNVDLDCCCSTNEPDARLDVFRDSQNAANSTNKNGNQITNSERFNSERESDVERQFTPCSSGERKFYGGNVGTIPRVLKNYENRWDAPHMWFCDKKLLRLLDPRCEANYKIFKDNWSTGNPVIVSNVGCNLVTSLWHPESFSNDFGDEKNDFIDCITGKVISNRPMSTFWDGFDDVAKRMCNSRGEPMLLKLKDWPSSMDFAEMLPDRFQDLMDCLPLKEYTHRNGRFNLVSHLPECFVRPDLGPKMYTAYGFAGNEHEYIGTTNLHLDMTDAVNVMVHVAITKNCKDFNYDWHMRRVIELIEEAGCDQLTMKRIHEDSETPGALWHIYHPAEADCIRDLLTKVASEQKTPVEQFSDPIHDQAYYLDDNLRCRLKNEYGIKGCTFVQFNGDAVFIPAGAPHQVRNLHNCIKVAEDFVSPENINHSYRMTQEFRSLSDDHSNHEDKLQVKNIVLHSIKDAVSILLRKYKQIGEQMSCD